MTAVPQGDGVVTITAHTTAPPASCPRCGTSSRHSHRDYPRRPRDLPLWEHAGRLGRRVRRFRCLNATCTPQTFAERVPPLVRPAAPRTGRLPAAVQPLGLALGGEAGARLGARLQVPTSPAPRLHLVRQLPDPPMATPAIRGGAEWALRRGRTYGTRLVDLERHRPIDLLPDRTADTLAAWLRAHPGVTILNRARSMEYARGAIQGAPAAPHVLDRWQLVRHLRDALERLLDRLQRRLAAPLPARQSAPAPTISLEARALRRSTTDQRARQERRARRFARDEKVQALQAQGFSTRHIAKTLQMRRTTVIRDLRPTVFPERAQARRVSLLDPDVAYRPTRGEDGGRHGVQLWRESQALGVAGTRRLVSNWVVLRRERWRGRPSASGRRPALPKEPAARLLPAPAEGMSRHRPAPRQLVWLL